MVDVLLRWMLFAGRSVNALFTSLMAIHRDLRMLCVGRYPHCHVSISTLVLALPISTGCKKFELGD